MKTNKRNKLGLVICIVLCSILTLASCSDEVDFGEQYKKTLYIVNSNDLLYLGEHSFNTENDEISISVYCASTQPIDKDLKVRLKVNRHALDSLNKLQNLADPEYVNRVMLPDANYQMEGEQYLTIKAGKQFGLLKIPFDFSGLDPDIPYSLPITLVSNNADYDLNPDLSSIVYEIGMINQYSGSYTGSSQSSPTSILGIQPTLKALSKNEVRLPIHNLDNDEKYLLTNFMKLTIADDNSVTIDPWGVADLTDLGGSFYDPVAQSFELHYRFTNSSAKTLTITSTIKNIDAPLVDEEQ